MFTLSIFSAINAAFYDQKDHTNILKWVIVVIVNERTSGLYYKHIMIRSSINDHHK
jgi:hypothetical protein